ncbi:hypothetical protein EJ04DRAFT_511681 [Polyplosphaeria fusca]|uniref:Uncharacterized protein n=1 Tax=Polyplosphaeria fusca TaxID=682080 RepID=A0A9P4V2F4_9PLEO|nr:hypothetical protein EJ04DRAFT_511681 [Polyplosphaeria fusca]
MNLLALLLTLFSALISATPIPDPDTTTAITDLIATATSIPTPNILPGNPPPFGPCNTCVNVFRHCLQDCGNHWQCQTICDIQTCQYRTAFNTRPCYHKCGYDNC